MPYIPTGRPPGRPKGSRTAALIKRGQKRAVGRQKATDSDRTTIETIDRIVTEALAAALPREPFKGGAVEFLMAIYKDPDQPIALRLDAAKAAAKYETPALQAVTMTNTDLFHAIEDPEELRRLIVDEAVRLGLFAASYTEMHAIENSRRGRINAEG
jgi:hypothetical protein